MIKIRYRPINRLFTILTIYGFINKSTIQNECYDETETQQSQLRWCNFKINDYIEHENKYHVQNNIWSSMKITERFCTNLK